MSPSVARRIQLALITGLLTSVAAAWGQTTWYVDDDAPNDPGPGDPSISDPAEDGTAAHPFDAIQEALTAAVDGDLVLVSDGLYTGTGNRHIDYLGKGVAVRSVNGAASCVVDCQQSDSGFWFNTGEPESAVLEGFTIRGAAGGGILIRNSSRPRILRCVITENSVGTGGGVFCATGSAAEIVESEIRGNIATYDSGTAGGGGIACINASITIRDSIISDNVAMWNGGGIYCRSSDVTLISCQLQGNRARTGGGFRCDDQSSLTADGCVLVQNSATNDAGLSCMESTLSLTNSVVALNSADEDSGGVTLDADCAAAIVNCVIAYNSAVSEAGGIFTRYNDSSVFNTIIWGNSAGENARQIGMWGVGMLSINFCDVEGGESDVYVHSGTLDWGPGNIDIDPGFAFGTDFHLMPGSPCIDAGTSTPPGGLPAADADGVPRPRDGDGNGTSEADIGAFEHTRLLPTIAVSPSSFYFQAFQDSANPPDQLLSIRDAGGQALNWTIATGSDWLAAVPEAGDSSGEIDEVALQVDVSGLVAGNYLSLLEIRDSTASNGPRVVPVRLQLNRIMRVPSQYPTIQAAIDAAVDGDRIVLADGVYTGPGNKEVSYLGKAITVISENGPEACIIDCEGSGSGFLFLNAEPAEALLAGVTVTGAEGAVTIHDSNATIRNCVLRDNYRAEFAAGLAIGDSAALIEDCIIRDNVSESGVGGIRCAGEGVVIRRCTVVANEGRTGGGIECDNTVVEFIDCEISRNRSSSGGAIHAYSGQVALSGCELAENYSGTGGALFSDGAIVSLDDCVLRGNWAAGGGGALSGGGQLAMSAVHVVDNVAGWGGGLSWGGGADLSNCLFGNNRATLGDGGAISTSSRLRAVNCAFVGNAASDAGGALVLRGSSSDSSLTNCVAWENTSPGGAPIVLWDYAGRGARLAISYCDVQGGEGAIHLDPLSQLLWGAGNIEQNPQLAFPDDPHLTAASPCIDAGTAAPPIGLPVSDLDGNPRGLDGDGNGVAAPDIGPFEFNPMDPSIALSARELAFNSPAGEDPADQVLSLRNCGGSLLEWRVATACDWLVLSPDAGESSGEIDDVIVHVDTGNLGHGRYECELLVTGDSAVNGPRTVRVVLELSGELHVPSQYATIQAAIDAAVTGDTVVVADGVYTGAGNKNLDCHGKSITVRSANGPAACIIDCEGDGRGFDLRWGETESTVLDGFTIINGSALLGGGIACLSASPTIQNCVIRGCQTVYDGGGIHCYSSRALIRDTTVEMNETTGDPYTISYGGGVSLSGGTQTLSNVHILNNVSVESGGGLSCEDGNVTLVNCVIGGNSAGSYGGGIYGHAVIGSDYRELTVTDCRIEDNSSNDHGGGVYYSEGVLTLERTVLQANASSARGGGLCLTDAAAATLVDCRIAGSNATANGGGIAVMEGSTLALTRSVVAHSYCSASGGALYCLDSTVNVSDSWLTDSVCAQRGGAIFGRSSDVTLTNTTMSRNSAVDIGGAICARFIGTAPWIVRNCILWDDPSMAGTEVAVVNGGALLIAYSDVQGGEAGAYVDDDSSLEWGPGNLDLDPRFVGPSFGDFHLHSNSPCIDAGDPDPAGLGAEDIDGHPRVVNGRVDIGADEFSQPRYSSGDLNCDEAMDGADIDAFFLALGDPAEYAQLYPNCDRMNGDMNSDGSLDGADIEAFFDCLASHDCP